MIPICTLTKKIFFLGQSEAHPWLQMVTMFTALSEPQIARTNPEHFNETGFEVLRPSSFIWYGSPVTAFSGDNIDQSRPVLNVQYNLSCQFAPISRPPLNPAVWSTRPLASTTTSPNSWPSPMDWSCGTPISETHIWRVILPRRFASSQEQSLGSLLDIP